jgi:hypothetical protein
MQTTRAGQMDSDTDEVVGWRHEELVRAGMDPDDAQRVALETWIDLHWATDLVRRGCPSATALRILL